MSQPVQGLTVTPLLKEKKCKEKKASDQKKSMMWRREQKEGIEDMRKPRNSVELNTEIVILAWTVEVCPLLDS